MKTEAYKIGKFREGESKLFDFPSSSFSLMSLIRRMKDDHWTKEPLNAMTLMQNPKKRVVLISLNRGTEINSYQTSDSIKFQVFEGKLEFHTNNETLTLEKGQRLTFYEKKKYRVTALGETIFLLTLAS